MSQGRPAQLSLDSVLFSAQPQPEVASNNLSESVQITTLDTKEIESNLAADESVSEAPVEAKAGPIVATVPSETSAKVLAPMLQDYLRYKRSYPEKLLLYQVGDFYEVFYQDAVTVSETLNIRLTSRNKEQSNPVPMCGVPIHAIDNYLPKLVGQGFSCVLVSQLEEQEEVKGRKGIVKREVSRVITPGIRFEEDGLPEKSRNYLAALCFSVRGDGALAYADVSTGILRVELFESFEEILEGVQRIAPSEIIAPSILFNVPISKSEGKIQDLKTVAGHIGAQVIFRPFDNPGRSSLHKRMATQFLNSVDTALVDSANATIAELDEFGIGAIDTILSYIDEVSFGAMPRIAQFRQEKPQTVVVLDAATRRNLELTETRIDGERKNSLLRQIDYTRTSMGYRMMVDWLLAPSADATEIISRHEAVQELTMNAAALEDIRALLCGVRDIERLVARITGLRATPKDLAVLRDSLSQLPELAGIFLRFDSPRLRQLASRFDALEDLQQKLKSALVEDPPLRLNEGDIFASGYDETVDKYRLIRKDGRKWLAEFEQSERERTGISSLKVRYNNVFGYFIEVTKTHLNKVPADFIRKQTLANAERFVTEALKVREHDILSARAKQIDAEKELFVSFRNWVGEQAGRIQCTAEVLSEIDLLGSFAHLAREHNYCRPKMSDTPTMHVVEARHPVVERVIGQHNFVANDIDLNDAARRFAVLTGPNMGGKSTYLRQVGLIQLLAQAGSFVPAAHAELGIVDRIFTRIGAADDLTRGDSTFMVEMREAATIVRKATPRSLVLIDEIGRGTATTDGLAIATAIAEWLLDTVRCKTIFATHFHELTELGSSREGAFCLSVGVVEENDELHFTHRIEERSAIKSYGVEVARLAGLPRALVQRAALLLQSLNTQRHEVTMESVASMLVSPAVDPLAEEMLERLQGLDVNTMTPLEALNALSDLCRRAHQR